MTITLTKLKYLLKMEAPLLTLVISTQTILTSLSLVLKVIHINLNLNRFQHPSYLSSMLVI